MFASHIASIDTDLRKILRATAINNVQNSSVKVFRDLIFFIFKTETRCIALIRINIPDISEIIIRKPVIRQTVSFSNILTY